MAIQNRRGNYEDFDPEKMLTGEPAVVIANDPTARDGRAAYIAFSPGVVKRMATLDEADTTAREAAESVIEAAKENIETGVQIAQNAAKEAVTGAEEAIVQAKNAAESAKAAAGSAARAEEMVNQEIREIADFKLFDQSIDFADSTTAELADERITEHTLADVYYHYPDVNEADRCELEHHTDPGKLVFTAARAPAKAIRCSIVFYGMEVLQ